MKFLKVCFLIFTLGLNISCNNPEGTGTTNISTEDKDKCITLAGEHYKCMQNIISLNTNQKQAWDNCKEQSLQYIEKNIQSATLTNKLQSVINGVMDKKLEQALDTNGFKIEGEVWTSGHLNVPPCGGMLKNADFITCSTLDKILRTCS